MGKGEKEYIEEGGEEAYKKQMRRGNKGKSNKKKIIREMESSLEAILPKSIFPVTPSPKSHARNHTGGMSDVSRTIDAAC